MPRESKNGITSDVKHVDRHQHVLPVAQLAERHFRVRVDERLLVDVAHALDVSHVVRVLGPQDTLDARLQSRRAPPSPPSPSPSPQAGSP